LEVSEKNDEGNDGIEERSRSAEGNDRFEEWAGSKLPPRSTPSAVAENVHRFAARQGGHVTREQLLTARMSRRTIDRWIASRRLLVVYRGVYAVGHLQSNPIDAAYAALLVGGEQSALAGGCALVLWDIWRYWPKRLEIVTAGSGRPTGLIVHHSKTLLKRDIKTVQGLRVTSPARTLLDTSTRLTPERLARAINDLRLRDLVTIEQLADVIARNPTHRGVTLLRPHLEYAQEEPTRSVLEDRFLPLLRKHGLPTPEINVRLEGYRVDAYFREQRLVVELDGWKTHRTKERFLADRRQDIAILAATGIPTVRLPYDDVGDGVTVPLRTMLSRMLEADRPEPAKPGL
jgi:very-short-patch-repair endonuclease